MTYIYSYPNRLFHDHGIEIWKQNNEYLVLAKDIIYGKFYKSLDDAKRDPILATRCYGVRIK